MKKLNNKGFTLIEMVIVIVIIAILAAMLVPSLLAYVNNANEKSFLTACDSIKTSTLTSMTNNYAETGEFAPVKADVEELVGGSVTLTLSEDGTIAKQDSKNTYYVAYTVSGSELSSMEIANNKYHSKFASGSWSTEAY